MNTTFPAPPAPPAPQPTPQPAGRPGKPVSIVLIVLGALILVATVLGAVRAAVAQARQVDDTLTASAAGVTSLDVDAEASSFRIEFDDVSEATLEVTAARSEWILERDGDELKVRTRDQLFSGWGPRFGPDEERVVLILPEALNDARLDADLRLAAGQLQADGDFGELDLELGAGSMTVAGSARALAADISAGTARVELADVAEADVTVSAGRLVAELTGTAPAAVTASVSAGALDLTLPEGEYDVRSDVAAGGLDNRLDNSRASSHSVTVDIAAGHVTLRSAR